MLKFWLVIALWFALMTSNAQIRPWLLPYDLSPGPVGNCYWPFSDDLANAQHFFYSLDQALDNSSFVEGLKLSRMQAKDLSKSLLRLSELERLKVLIIENDGQPLDSAIYKRNFDQLTEQIAHMDSLQVLFVTRPTSPFLRAVSQLHSLYWLQVMGCSEAIPFELSNQASIRFLSVLMDRNECPPKWIYSLPNLEGVAVYMENNQCPEVWSAMMNSGIEQVILFSSMPSSILQTSGIKYLVAYASMGDALLKLDSIEYLWTTRSAFANIAGGIDRVDHLQFLAVVEAGTDAEVNISKVMARFERIESLQWLLINGLSVDDLQLISDGKRHQLKGISIELGNEGAIRLNELPRFNVLRGLILVCHDSAAYELDDQEVKWINDHKDLEFLGLYNVHPAAAANDGERLKKLNVLLIDGLSWIAVQNPVVAFSVIDSLEIIPRCRFGRCFPRDFLRELDAIEETCSCPDGIPYQILECYPYAGIENFLFQKLVINLL